MLSSLLEQTIPSFPLIVLEIYSMYIVKYYSGVGQPTASRREQNSIKYYYMFIY